MIRPEPDCPDTGEVRTVSFIYCDHCGGNHVGIQTATRRDGRGGATAQYIWCMDCRVMLGGRM